MPQGIREPLMVRGPDTLAVHCRSVCSGSGSALLGDLVVVSRSMECVIFCPSCYLTLCVSSLVRGYFLCSGILLFVHVC